MKNFIKRWPFLSLLLISFAVVAATVTINTADTAYRNLNNVVGTNIHTEPEIRMAAGFTLSGAYRNIHGFGTLGDGSQFKVVWQDGSSETYVVNNRFMSDGTMPVPGTQQPGGTGGGGGPGGYPDDPGYGGGDDPFSDCFSETVTGCVSVGDGPMQCETFTVLNCPFG
jgi:hypothetical protein